MVTLSWIAGSSILSSLCLLILRTKRTENPWEEQWDALDKLLLLGAMPTLILLVSIQLIADLASERR